MPLYFIVLGSVQPEAILLMQILMTYCVLLILHKSGIKQDTTIVSRISLKKSLVPALFISCNWLIYLFAMLTGNAVDAGLGYLFTPFVIIVLSRIVFREKLAFHQAIGAGVCVAGVLVYIAIGGVVPVFGFGLAITFGLYATWHRRQQVADSLAALRQEMMLIAPAAAAALLVFVWTGYSIPLETWAILTLLGPLTLLPLFLFVSACRLGISAVDLGACQFLAPVISIAVGVLFMDQEFTPILGVLLASLGIGISISLLAGRRFKGAVL